MPIESYQITQAKMARMGVRLPPEKKLISEPFPPSLFVVSALMREGNKEFGVNTSYIKPDIEKDANPTSREFDIEFPPSVILLCKNIRTLGGRAVVAGGCIRDLLYSEITGRIITPKDFDIEVYGLDIKTLEKLLHKTFPKNSIHSGDKSYKVFKIYHIDGLSEPLDVALARKDSSTGIGHKDFENEARPHTSLLEGSRRRDLRFNSLTYDPLRKIMYDPFMGEIDLKNNELNITDPETFIEDPIRVLRIMQFSARFETTPDDSIMEICKTMIKEGKLDTVSYEAMREELIKLLTRSRKPSIGLQFAKDIGFIKKYWHELAALIDTPQHPDFHPEGDVWNHNLQALDAAAEIAQREGFDKETYKIFMLTVLCHDFGKPATTQLVEGIYRAFGHEKAGIEPTRIFLERLRFENKIIKPVLTLVPKHMTLSQLHRQENPQQKGKEKIDSIPALKKLARKLWKEAELPLSLLMHITEADHKGRNGNSSEPLTNEELPEIVELKEWFTKKTELLQITETPEPPLFSNKLFLVEKQAKGGTWIGLISRCVLLDQEEDVVSNKQEAQERGLYYYNLMQKHLKQKNNSRENESEINCTSKIHHDVWKIILNEKDPRNLLSSQ